MNPTCAWPECQPYCGDEQRAACVAAIAFPAAASLAPQQEPGHPATPVPSEPQDGGCVAEDAVERAAKARAWEAFNTKRAPRDDAELDEYWAWLQPHERTCFINAAGTKPAEPARHPQIHDALAAIATLTPERFIDRFIVGEGDDSHWNAPDLQAFLGSRPYGSMYDQGFNDGREVGRSEAEPACKLRDYGFNEGPWTYKNQPGNVGAWAMGSACRKAAEDPNCGDYIDRGLILLRELQAEGFGVYAIGVKEPEPARVGGEAVGEIVPRYRGNTVVQLFDADSLPVGTKLYTTPPAMRVNPEAVEWQIRRKPRSSDEWYSWEQVWTEARAKVVAAECEADGVGCEVRALGVIESVATPQQEDCGHG